MMTGGERTPEQQIAAFDAERWNPLAFPRMAPGWRALTRELADMHWHPWKMAVLAVLRNAVSDLLWLAGALLQAVAEALECPLPLQPPLSYGVPGRAADGAGAGADGGGADGGGWAVPGSGGGAAGDVLRAPVGAGAGALPLAVLPGTVPA